MTSGAEEAGDRTLLRRVPVILRSWDGPNSRIGLEVDLAQMPWGPFDALGQRLSLLLPTDDDVPPSATSPESEVERALRYVEHAADRCGEFAQLGTEHRELWLRARQTWEWIRRYLTRLWMETEVEGGGPGRDEASQAPGTTQADRVPGPSEGTDSSGQRDAPEAPRLPGAAGTLRIAAQALRATPLSVWRESVGAADPEGPTREESVQTLLGLANLLGAADDAQREKPPTPSTPESEPVPEEPSDPDHVSFEFAKGYDEGYQMGRRVGLALGGRKKDRARRP